MIVNQSGIDARTLREDPLAFIGHLVRCLTLTSLAVLVGLAPSVMFWSYAHFVPTVEFDLPMRHIVTFAQISWFGLFFIAAFIDDRLSR